MSRNVGSVPQISSMGITINLMVSVPIIPLFPSPVERGIVIPHLPLLANKN